MASDLPDTPVVDAAWRPLLRLGAVAAILVLVMMPIQAVVFIVSPPPTGVLDFFALFQRNPLLGLVDLDLLLTLDYLAMIPFYLALFVIVRRVAPSWGLLALVTGLFSLLLFLVSREATFSLWMLSGQHAATADAAQRAALVAAGQTLLTLYNGGTFGLSYVLGAVSTLLYSAVLFGRRVFGRAPGIVGIITGITMLLPPNTGPAGLVVALLSLIPTAVWLVLLSRAFLRTTRTTSSAA